MAGGHGVAAFRVRGIRVHRLEDAGHRLLLQPLARVSLVHTGHARQLGRRRRARVRECSVHPEAIAQVDAEKIHGPQRAAEEPLDQLVTTCVGGTCGRHGDLAPVAYAAAQVKACVVRVEEYV